MIGTTLKPEDAYRFAMGAEVTSSSGLRARLIRPLDFLVVSDHAESLGLPIAIDKAMPELLNNPWGRRVYDLEQKGGGYAGFYMWAMDGMLPDKSSPSRHLTLQTRRTCGPFWKTMKKLRVEKYLVYPVRKQTRDAIARLLEVFTIEVKPTPVDFFKTTSLS